MTSNNPKLSSTIRTLFQALPEGGVRVPPENDRLTVPELLLPPKPRVLGFYFGSAETDSFIGSEHLDPNLVKLYRSRNAVVEYVSSRDIEMQKAFESRDVDILRQVISDMDPTEAEYHMKRCVDSGLWTA